MKQGSNRQKTMEDTDGGLHPVVDGQSLGERWKGIIVHLAYVSAGILESKAR